MNFNERNDENRQLSDTCKDCTYLQDHSELDLRVEEVACWRHAYWLTAEERAESEASEVLFQSGWPIGDPWGDAPEPVVYPPAEWFE